MKNYDTYLFDADGTLFDTAEMVCQCYQHVAALHAGTNLDRSAIMAGYGLPLKGHLLTLLGNHIDIDQVMNDYMNFQLEILEESITPFPQVIETLAALKDGGKLLAIVTSRRRYSMERILDFTHTRQFFDVVVTPEDTNRHKPDAEPALLALQKLGASPQRAIFTGDAEYDILSGTSAGTDTAFVSWSHLTPGDLPIQPTWAIDAMTDLLQPTS